MSRNDIAVIVTTYNQVRLIGQCIESALAQETIANITIYVHDDYSNDGTQDVIKYYEQKHPGKVIPVLSNFNKLSNRRSPILDMVRYVDEDFIAFLNGDDYWIDKTKLEKQQKLMLENVNVGLVHTAFQTLNLEDTNAIPESESPSSRMKRSRFGSSEDFLIGVQAKESSVMIRKSKIDHEFIEGSDHLVATDWILYLSIALKWDILFLDQETLVHRISKHGVWNGAQRKLQETMKSEVRWFAASKCPNLELRRKFRKKVTSDFFLNQIEQQRFLYFLLKSTRPLRHPIRQAQIFRNRWQN